MNYGYRRKKHGLVMRVVRRLESSLIAGDKPGVALRKALKAAKARIVKEGEEKR